MAKSYFKQNYCHACHTRFAVRPVAVLRNTGGQSLPRSQCYRRESKMVDEVEYSQFLAVHKGQLIMADIPEQYWTTLHKKLKNEASFMPVSEYIAEFRHYFSVLRVVSARGICSVKGHLRKNILTLIFCSHLG